MTPVAATLSSPEHTVESNAPSRVAELQARIRSMQATKLDSKLIPTHPAIAGLLPGGGLQQGAAYSVDSSAMLLMTLLAAPSAAGSWCAVVGVPEFGVEAAGHFGIDLDRLVRQEPVSVEAFSAYVTLNARFHALLTELCASAPVIRQIDRASAMPFASPSAFVMAQSALPEAHTILLVGQEHHRIVIDAIENREGARAEAIMREHARLAVRNLRLALRNRSHLDLLPALALVTSATTD